MEKVTTDFNKKISELNEHIKDIEEKHSNSAELVAQKDEETNEYIEE
jgi:hypothetical protein